MVNYLNLFNIIKLNLKLCLKFINLLKYKKISNLRKEKISIQYSKLLLISSLKILMIIFSILIIILIFEGISESFVSFILSFNGIVEIAIIVFIYHKFKKMIYV